jgi:acetyl-CoA C-acetyltransferase
MRALEVSCQQIVLGKSKCALVCGMESMSNVPYLLTRARQGFRMGDSKAEDGLWIDGFTDVFSQMPLALTAETVAARYGVSRKEQDEYASLSHQRAVQAGEKGYFKEEIVPIEIKSKKESRLMTMDEHPRLTSVETLSKLKPVFKKDGTITAGNASGICDGACALVIMPAAYAGQLGLKPLARILSTATYGVEPEVMGIGPVYAIPQAIKEAGLKAGDIEYYEINEAFAAQVVACLKELKLDLSRVNANGAGISLGHPVGMTGIRLIVSGYYEMQRRNVQYGCASLCAAGGPGMATGCERLP